MRMRRTISVSLLSLSAACAHAPMASEAPRPSAGARVAQWPLRAGHDLNGIEPVVRRAAGVSATTQAKTLFVQRLEDLDVGILTFNNQPGGFTLTAGHGSSWASCTGRVTSAGSDVIVARIVQRQRRYLVVVGPQWATSIRVPRGDQPPATVNLRFGAGVFTISPRVTGPVSLFNGHTLLANASPSCTALLPG